MLCWNVSQIPWKIPYFFWNKRVNDAHVCTNWYWTLIDFWIRTKMHAKRYVCAIFATIAQNLYGAKEKKIKIIKSTTIQIDFNNNFNGRATLSLSFALLIVLNIRTHAHNSQQVFLSKDLLKWRKREFRSSTHVCTHTHTHRRATIGPLQRHV